MTDTRDVEEWLDAMVEEHRAFFDEHLDALTSGRGIVRWTEDGPEFIPNEDVFLPPKS